MIEPTDSPDEGTRIYRLGLKVWLEQRTHADEEDEWRGEVYDQLEPRVREGFRGLQRLAEIVTKIVQRIRAGDRARVERPEESRRDG